MTEDDDTVRLDGDYDNL